jgi:hypothetical protein
MDQMMTDFMEAMLRAEMKGMADDLIKAQEVARDAKWKQIHEVIEEAHGVDGIPKPLVKLLKLAFVVGWEGGVADTLDRAIKVTNKED